MARPDEDDEWMDASELDCIMYDLGYAEGQTETENSMLGLGITHPKAETKLLDLAIGMEFRNIGDVTLGRQCYYRGRADARRDKVEREIKGEV